MWPFRVAHGRGVDRRHGALEDALSRGHIERVELVQVVHLVQLFQQQAFEGAGVVPARELALSDVHRWRGRRQGQQKDGPQIGDGREEVLGGVREVHQVIDAAPYARVGDLLAAEDRADAPHIEGHIVQPTAQDKGLAARWVHGGDASMGCWGGGSSWK